MATFSVNDQARRAQSTGNGSATEFSFSFQVNSTSDIKVYIGDTLKTLSTHYTIVDSSAAAGLNTDGTGVVKFITSPTDYTPADGDVVTILSDVPVARTSVYTSGGNITAASLESDFDTITMQVADREERDARQLTAPVSDPTSIDMTLPAKASRLGKALGFNSSSGNPEAITVYQTAADVRAAVEAASDSNVFTDDDHSKLDGIAASANNYSHPNHTGDVTSSGDGATTIAADAVTGAKIADDAVDSEHIANGAIDLAHMSANSVDSDQYVDGSIDTAHIGDDQVTYAKIQNVSATNVVLGRDSSGAGVIEEISASSLRTILNVEDGATSDQSASEIETIVNHDNLQGFVANEHIDWTADQGATNIHSGNYTNTTYSVGDGGLTQNNFTDALKSKLDAIEANATADQTDAQIRAAVEAATDSNVFTDADHSKLDAIEANATADQTASEIKTAYESNSDTNAFTDADHSKLDGIATSANNYVHPNHSGEVTSTGDGATVIADNVVDEANLKVSNSPTDGYVLTARSGNTGGLTWEASDSNPNYTKVSLSHSGSQQTRYIKIATLNTATPSTSNSTFVFSILLDGRGSDQGASEFTVHIRSGDLSATSSVVVEQNHNNKHSIYGTDSFIFLYNNQYDSEFWFKLPNSGATSYQAVFAKLIMAANQDTTYVSGQDDVTIHTGQSWFSSAPSGTNQITAQWIKKKFSNILLDGVITEDVYNVTLGSGTHQIKPSDDGGIFYMTVSVNCSLGVSNLENGQSQVLMIDDGSGNTITWPTMTWVNNGGSAPTLSTTARTTVVVWKANNVVYGALVGDGT